MNQSTRSVRPTVRISRVLFFLPTALVVAVLMSGISQAQPTPGLPDIDVLGVVPLDPTILDDVTAHVEGTVDISFQAINRVVSQRTGNSILVDLLFDEFEGIPIAGPNPQPYAEDHGLGMLPVGTYQLTARTFTSVQFGGTFPDPWDFPEVFPDVVGAGPTDETFINFTVVPEPTSLVLLATVAGAIGLLRRRRR